MGATNNSLPLNDAVIKANLAKVEEEYRLIKSRIGLTPDLLDGGDDITEGVFEREDGFFEIRESLDDDEDTEVESTQRSCNTSFSINVAVIQTHAFRLRAL
jgi:hypothetical protein